MAKKKGVRVVLLVEDEDLERFVRHALIKVGFSRHEMHRCNYPVGKNAKHWVTQEYPKQVQAYRREANHQQVALLVGTDADQQTVSQRSGDLEAALAPSGLDSRAADERIVFWIPRWHVETWLLFLAGQDVGEDANCKHQVHDPDFADAGRRFVDRFRDFRRDPRDPYASIHENRLPRIRAIGR